MMVVAEVVELAVVEPHRDEYEEAEPWAPDNSGLVEESCIEAEGVKGEEYPGYLQRILSSSFRGNCGTSEGACYSLN